MMKVVYCNILKEKECRNNYIYIRQIINDQIFLSVMYRLPHI